MKDYNITAYVRTRYLPWVLEGIKLIMEKYGANLHGIHIDKRVCRLSHCPCRRVRIWISLNNPKILPYIERRLGKEVGVLV